MNKEYLLIDGRGDHYILTENDKGLWFLEDEFDTKLIDPLLGAIMKLRFYVIGEL
jgi:hypothetical protein